ncbi:outer membrane protein assembly factor BamB family protein [Aporhodopirellula aestuarii]|uniref:PQQ-binding-like beta-propeller repeat protein n=1 Tax=Aporhodopirellula aestuarii TaxID=2950107 RepID=A0ABT0U0E9_9BACT|nr:PQQ-binding-like beta-propeller repeat protein [Aporhodopirellula aestuarii]MCM2370348.1 PQQ-binding-like beta-propeller repeat protein [Aporhodopirellula aestuarii]
MTKYDARLRDLLVLFLFCVTPLANDAWADWPSWRGIDDHGSRSDGNYPAVLDESTMRWSAPLPGKGCSTPILFGQNLYLTAPVDGKDSILSIDTSGAQRWSTSFATEVSGKHRNGSGCNASPVTDGQGVFAYFKSGTLAAVELDGTERWTMNLVERFGPDQRFWDHGTSPVLTQNHVVIARMHAGDSWVAAFDKVSGELAWKVARNYKVPKECDQCYTTPLVIRHSDREAILVWGAEHVTIHDVSDGKELWSCGRFNPDANMLWPAIATPVIVDDVAVVCFGRNDRGTPQLHGIRLDGSGDVTETNHVWFRDDISSFVPSPAVYEGRVYLLRDKGEVECLDPATGETIWSDRLPKNRADYYASPLIAGGKLYAAREDGVVFVVDISNDRLEMLSEKDFGEPVIGSPIPGDDCLYIRGEDHLFCFATAGKAN